MSSSANRKGFTLIEVLVAIAVGAVGLLTIFELYPLGFAASGKSQARVQATALATDILACCRRELLKTPTNWTIMNMTKTGAAWSNNYSAFTGVTADPTFYYQVWVEQVTDQNNKYKIFPPIGVANYNNLGSPPTANETSALRQLMRVSVFVRGPFATLADANAYGGVNQLRRSPAVQVNFVTLVADNKLGQTNLRQAASPGQTRIYVNDISHFTAFNPSTLGISTLYARPNNSQAWPQGGQGGSIPTGYSVNKYVEYEDTGPFVSTANAGTGARGLNQLKLDNVWIGPLGSGVANDDFTVLNNLTSSSTFKPPVIAYVGESNKIVDMGFDTTANLYYLDLLNPIRGSFNGSTFVAYPNNSQVNGLIGVQVPPP